MLNEYILSTRESGCWNFGPENENDKTVERVLTSISKNLGHEISWEQEQEEQPHEAGILTLDSKKARTLLNWTDTLKFEQSVGWTANWYKKFLDGANPGDISLDQVKEFYRLVHTQRTLI
jgi:CDP-glucose 4,6-dehydratase